MGATADLARTNLLALESNLDFHPASLLWTLLRTKLIALPTLPLCMIGNPRYLPRLLVARIPSFLHIVLFLLSMTLGEKKILDLQLLTFYLARLQKLLRTSMKALQFLELALAKTIMSSAKKT